MSITKTNINVSPSPVNNSPGIPCHTHPHHGSEQKVIKVHKSYEDAIEYASRIVMPTGAMDTVFYRDSNKNVLCLIVVGNIPNNPPIVFTGAKQLEKHVETITETVITETNNVINNTVQWNDANKDLSSTNNTGSNTQNNNTIIIDGELNWGDF